MGLSRPKVSGSANGKPAGSPEDQGFLHEWPTVYAYLTDDVWEDGTDRQRSTIILFAEDLFKCCLVDKDSDATLWASGTTLEDLFSALESRLRDPEADWRRRKAPVPSKKR